MRKVVGIFILLLFQYGYAQVGINTTNPQEALDVNGKIRVTDTDIGVGRTMVSIIGVDNNEVLSKIKLSSDFVITNNTITVSGTTSYSVVDINLYVDIVHPLVYPLVYPEWHPEAGDPHPFAGDPHPEAGLPVFQVGDDIINLDLGVNNTNAHETVIRFVGQTQPFDISGITGGVPGRHILLLNPTPFAMGVIKEDSGSYPKTRILTYANNVASTEGQGAIELVYDGTRWILLNIRD